MVIPEVIAAATAAPAEAAASGASNGVTRVAIREGMREAERLNAPALEGAIEREFLRHSTIQGVTESATSRAYMEGLVDRGIVKANDLIQGVQHYTFNLR